MKKLISIFLILALLCSVMPTAIFAVESRALSIDEIDAQERNPGDTFAVNVNIKNNTGYFNYGMYIDYDKEVLSVVSVEKGEASSTAFSETDSLPAPAFADLIMAANPQAVDGTLAKVTFQVKENVSVDSTMLTLVVDEFGNEDDEDIAQSLTGVTATITIAGAEEGLSFTNGTDSYEFATLQKDDYTLTSPGDGYYFAGWFTGLAAADTASEALSLTDGYYVLADNSVADSDTFAITELRPKYADAAPETGAYHALWIYDDETGENPVTAIVLQVSDNSVTYRKADNAEGVYTGINATVLTNAIDGAAGTARIKLIKDMELVSDVFSSANGIKLDMNGCTILETNIQIKAHLFDLAGGTGVFESSRGKGTITVETVDGNGSSAAISTTADTTLYLRDLNITSEGYAYRHVAGKATVEYIRNCTINAKNDAIFNDRGPLTSTGMIVKELSGCHITSAEHVFGENWDYETELLNISDTTLIATGYEEVFDCVIATFQGDGNVVKNTGTGNLFGYSEVTFESAGGTYVASSGTAIGSKVTTTAPEGYIVQDNSGTLSIVTGFTVDYYNNSGSDWLADSTFTTGETAESEWMRDDVREGLEYSQFIGWSLQKNVNITDMDKASSVLVDWSSITEDTKVYAAYYVYYLDPTVSATYTVGGVATAETKYYNIEDALAAAKAAGAESLTVKLITDTALKNTISYTDMDITIDLMGYTLSAATGSGGGNYLIANDSNGGWLGWGCTGGSGELTICSTGNRGAIELYGYQLVVVVAGNSNVGTVTISNVDITRTGQAYGLFNGMFGFFNHNKSATSGNLILDDVTVNTTSYVFATYVNSNTATSGYRITATDCTFESTYDSILGYMNKGDGKNAPQNFSITFDSATKFKSNNAAAPVLSTFASYVSGPEGTELTAGTDGWYTFKTPLNINGTSVSGTSHSAAVDSNGVVTVTNPGRLNELESLTVTNGSDKIVFSAAALDSIAGKVTTDALTIKVAPVANASEIKRIELTVTDGNEAKVEFEGSVDVTMTFTGEVGQTYAVYYDNNGTGEKLNAAITNSGNAFTATFTVDHFSEYYVAEVTGPVYTLEVEFDKETYKTGDTVTANIILSGTAGNDVGGIQFALDTAAMTGMTLNALTPASGFDNARISGGSFAWAWSSAEAIDVSESVPVATATFIITDDALGKTIELGLGGTIEVVRYTDSATSYVTEESDSATILYTINISDSTVINIVTGATVDTSDPTKYYTDGSGNITFKVAAPGDQKVISSVTYNGNALTLDGDVYTIPADDIIDGASVVVNYIEYYTVTFAAGANGTLSGSTTAYVEKGEAALYTDTTFSTAFNVPTITPNKGYRVASPAWKEGTNGVTGVGSSYVPEGNVTLTAQYAQNAVITVIDENCTINITGGTTTEDGVIYANSSAPVTFTVTPADGNYVLDRVSYIIDNTSYPLTAAGEVYTVPTSALTDGAVIKLSAIYKPYYKITFKSGANGTINGGITDIVAYAIAGSATLYTTNDFEKVFAVPTIAAAEGYRIADAQWTDGSNKIQTSVLGVTYTFDKDTTLTAQYVKTWTIKWIAGENGSFAQDAVTSKVVDDGSNAANFVDDAPEVTPNAGYVFDGWEDIMTGTIETDFTYKATYSHATYTLSVTDINGITWAVTGNGVSGSGTTYTVTHGSDVTITMTDSSADVQIDAIMVNGEAVDGFDAGSTTYTWTIEGDSITDGISITVESTATYTVTITVKDEGVSVAGVSVATESVTYVTGADLDLSDFGISYTAGYELDDIVDSSSNSIFDEYGKIKAAYATVTADAAYTVSAKHSQFSVTYPDNTTTTATHGTDFTINMSKATANAVIKRVLYTVGGGEAVELEIDTNGNYVIDGDKIIGAITVTFEYLKGASWEFISFDDYAALISESGTQVAILKTAMLSNGTYSLDDVDMFWSSKYKGYVYIVGSSETAITLSAKLAANENKVVELLYTGDINGSGNVTAADATVINAALQHTENLSYEMTIRMLLEMDVTGNKKVTTEDITAVLTAALGAVSGS